LLRFGFLGTEGPLARATLSALLAAGAIPETVIALGLAPVVSRAPAPSVLALATPASVVSLATDAGINVRHCPTDEKAIAALLLTLASRPQLMVVACLPIILQPATFELAEHGFVNVHPSLLPAFRGPQPAFWQLHAGRAQGGVSVHQMDAGVDTGALLLQSTFALESGTTEQVLDQRAGSAAGTLLASNLANWPPAPQLMAGKAIASYQSAPDANAYRIDACSWNAARAFCFIRGTAWRGITFEITGENWRARVNQVLEIRKNQRGASARAEGCTCALPFADATLIARGRLHIDA
jgi:methionyl-tRNA formyltransferase